MESGVNGENGLFCSIMGISTYTFERVNRLECLLVRGTVTVGFTVGTWVQQVAYETMASEVLQPAITYSNYVKKSPLLFSSLSPI